MKAKDVYNKFRDKQIKSARKVAEGLGPSEPGAWFLLPKSPAFSYKTAWKLAMDGQDVLKPEPKKKELPTNYIDLEKL